MNKLADELADKKVGSIFLYTHEAHPGENYPHLTSIKQKFSNARDLRDIYGVSCPIFVDALDGACHRAYGSLPNITWIFNKQRMVLYRSAWTDIHSVEGAIRDLLEVNECRRNRVLLTPFYVEKMDYPVVDREGFTKGLEKSGPKAVKEFSEAFE